MPLDEFIEWFDEHHTISGHPLDDERPLDGILDYTHEQAKEAFARLLDECILLDGCEVRSDTPDGNYIGILF